jgi:hypothetical protein
MPGVILLAAGNAIFATMNVKVTPQFHGHEWSFLCFCDNMTMKATSTSEMQVYIYKAP